jgi:hypothetical protein
MRHRGPFALLTIATLLGCTASPRRNAGMEPAALFLFARTHTPTPCESQAQTGTRLVVRSPNRPAHSVLRAEQLSLSRAEVPALSMRVGPAQLEVTGETTDNYSVQLCAEAGAASEKDAQALLEQVRLSRADKMVLLTGTQATAEWPSSAYVQVQAPQDAPIAIDGEYAAIRVMGMRAPVKLSTTHARITLIDTTGDVDAKAAEFGVIDFSGERGHVRLDSAWEINLNFTGERFEGSLDAKAAQPVRVLLPPGFASSFEATVRRKTDFACRADLCDRVSVHKKDGKFVFTYGSGEPALHFTSENGLVLVDSTDRLQAVSRRH